MYQVQFVELAKQDLDALDPTVRNVVLKAIRAKLISHPAVFGKPLRHPLGGLWSLRVGDYRVVYYMSNTAVQVLVIDRRSTAYQEALKRLK